VPGDPHAPAKADRMKTFAGLAAALVLAPVPGGAHPRVAPPTVGIPPGITVTGRAVVRATVKTVQFTAMARGALDEATVLSALRTAGIEDPLIGPTGGQLFLSNNGPTTLRGTIHDVSRAKLDGIERAAAAFIVAHPGVALDNVQFTARPDDCDAVEQGARTAALGDAHRKAQAIAGSAGVALGEPLAVAESGGCPLAGDQIGQQNGPGAFDLGALTVSIAVTETVTYAIDPAGSTRRHVL
jgi:hypothetical protein